LKHDQGRFSSAFLAVLFWGFLLKLYLPIWLLRVKASLDILTSNFAWKVLCFNRLSFGEFIYLVIFFVERAHFTVFLIMIFLLQNLCLQKAQWWHTSIIFLIWIVIYSLFDFYQDFNWKYFSFLISTAVLLK